MDIRQLIDFMNHEVEQVQERIRDEFDFLHTWERKYSGGEMGKTKFQKLTGQVQEMLEILEDELSLKQAILEILIKNDDPTKLRPTA